jgi:phosphate transport system substrate-binding protein
MKLVRFLQAVSMATILSAGAALAQVKTITGAGATFPYPVYSKWAERYRQEKGVALNYQSIGSGGGVQQIKAKTVDFGASDEPMKPEELEKSGLVQWPMVIGGVVPVLNVPGIQSGQMKFSGDLLSEIFLGKITKWNDPKIAELNPDLKLPNLKIVVVHRADGSGTSFLFTDYLSKVSPEWKEKVGSGKAVKWPSGMGGKGNEGVANFVHRIPGAIGYVEFAYAAETGMTYAKLKNRDGQFVAPEMESFEAAAANADWSKAPGFYLILNNQPGDTSWPITGASFILMHKEQADAEKAKAVLSFFAWAYHNGADMAKELHYIPIPNNVVELVQDMWAKEIKDAKGNPIIFKP